MHTNSRIFICPSTADDFVEVTGSAPPVSCRSWSVYYDGELAGVAGVTISRNAAIFFSNMKKDTKYPAKAIWSVANFIVSEVFVMNKTVFAIGSAESDKFLKRLGFYYIGRFNDLEYYQLWQK